MRGAWNDLKFGLRMLRSNRSYAALGVLTVALGIGVTTAVFTLVSGVLLQALPYPDSDRLVAVWERNEADGKTHWSLTPAGYRWWREGSDSLAAMAAFRDGLGVALTDDGEPVRVAAGLVAPDLFTVLGATPLFGRTFTGDEGEPAGEPVVVLSHGLWQRRYAGDPGVVGSTILVEGVGRRIVGVMPEGFAFPRREVALWLPLVLSPAELDDWRSHNLSVVGRLAPGATLKQACAELDAMALAMQRRFPEHRTGWRAELVPLLDETVGGVRQLLLTLLIASGVVLLVACGNVANLVLARGAARHGELAVRAALGAGRGRVVRQLVTECLVLASAGGALGLALAAGVVRAIVALAPSGLPRLDEVRMDGGVFAYSLAACALTVVVFGLAPALRSSRAACAAALRAGGRSLVGDRSPLTLRSAVIVAEVALSLVLLAGAALLVRSFERVCAVDPGFVPDDLLTVHVLLPETRYPELAEQAAFFDEVIGRLDAVDGVVSCGATTDLPVSGVRTNTYFLSEGDPPPEAGAIKGYPYQAVTAGYLSTLGVPLLAGRHLEPADGASSAPVVVVNQALADAEWSGEDALGQRVSFSDSGGPWYTVVGVVGNTIDQGLEAAIEPAVFAPHGQRHWQWMRWMWLVVRTSGSASSWADAVRHEIWEVDPDLPLENIRTMRRILDADVATRRFTLLLGGSFAGVALAMALVGLYGVIACGVAQRRSEIGLRLALGATPPQVLRQVIRRSSLLAVAGVAAGLLAMVFVAHLLSPLLFRVDAFDPLILGAVSLAVLAAALVAAWWPAWRASRIAPSRVLHPE